MKLAPNDVQVHLALAEAQYRLHRYEDSLATLKSAVGLSPNNSIVYAEMGRAYARLRQKDNAYKAVAEAEKAGDDSKVLMTTGETLLFLGDEHAAMQRYSRALDAPGSDRVEVRLALARLFVQSGKRTDARDQVAFALAEARVGEANAVTPENLVDAGRVLASINDYELAKKYFVRAQSQGAEAGPDVDRLPEQLLPGDGPHRLATFGLGHWPLSRSQAIVPSSPFFSGRER